MTPHLHSSRMTYSPSINVHLQQTYLKAKIVMDILSNVRFAGNLEFRRLTRDLADALTRYSAANIPKWMRLGGVGWAPFDDS